MSRAHEANVLLGALLDRLGNTQAQALLVRLDQWLTRDGGVRLEAHGLTEIKFAPSKPVRSSQARCERNPKTAFTVGVVDAKGRQS